MIRFKLSRGVIYGGGKCGKAGEVVDLSETDAQVLTMAKAGEVYEGESKAPESESVPEVPKKKGKK